MKLNKRFLLILVLGIGAKGLSQTGDQNAGWNYSFYPSGEEYTTVSKTELYGNFNSVFKDLRLEHSLRFEMDQLDLPIEYWTDDNDSTRLYDFSYAIKLVYSITEFTELQLEVKPVFSSTFEHKFSTEDVFLYGGAFALLRGEIASKPSFLKIGIAYSHHLGEPEFLPALAFSSMVSEKLSLTLGFPESEIVYRFNPSNIISAGLQFEGKYVNLGSTFLREEENSADKLKWEWSSLEVNYSHDLSTLLSIEIGGGYLLKNEFSLRNENEETLSTIKLDPYPFLSSGIKLKFK